MISAHEAKWLPFVLPLRCPKAAQQRNTTVNHCSRSDLLASCSLYELDIGEFLSASWEIPEEHRPLHVCLMQEFTCMTACVQTRSDAEFRLRSTNLTCGCVAKIQSLCSATFYACLSFAISWDCDACKVKKKLQVDVCGNACQERIIFGTIVFFVHHESSNRIFGLIEAFVTHL